MREYIYKGDAIFAVSALPLALDAETTQRAIEAVRAVPAADIVPWDWLKKFAEGKRYNYLSDFLIEAKVVFYRELVEEAGG